MIKKNPCEIFQCTEKDFQSFEEVDVFNDNKVLKGYICHKDGQFYGSMIIAHINGIQTIEGGIVVYGTPKQKYPFDRNGIWHFPPVEKINIYEKYDGTNVVSYRYIYRGQNYVSYKLRLTPVIHNSRWGNFLDMWKKMMIKYPIIRLATRRFDMSFELYGRQNKHLIEYDIDLDVALLFAIDKKGDIIDLEDLLPEIEYCVPLRIPWTKKEAEIRGKTDLVSYYKRLQGQKEAMMVKLPDGTLKGSEGSVWYLHTVDGNVIQYKMKPESVEAIHWKEGIGKNVILTTVMNCYESINAVDFESVKILLLEEFLEKDIDQKKDLILECIKEVEEQIIFKEEVLSFYNKEGLDVVKDKRETMKILSQKFPKDLMRNVYTIVAKEGSEKNERTIMAGVFLWD